MTLIFPILILVGSLAISFLLSGMEAGVFALSPMRVRQLTRKGNRSAQVLLKFLKNPENFLWTILVGNAIANFIAMALVVIGLHSVLYEWPLAYLGSLLLSVFVLYALGDLLPKMLFRQYPNRLCLYLARPFQFIHWQLRPLVSLMTWLAGQLLKWTGGRTYTGDLFASRDELRVVMQESAEGFTSEERSMIARVMDLPGIALRQIVRPMDRSVSLPVTSTVQNLFETVKERQLSRVPVFQDRPSRIVGIVSVDALLYQESLQSTKSLGEVMKPALYLEGHLPLEEALRRMQRSGQRMAIVTAPDGEAFGVVSWQDILRVVFGEVSL